MIKLGISFQFYNSTLRYSKNFIETQKIILIAVSAKVDLIIVSVEMLPLFEFLKEAKKHLHKAEIFRSDEPFSETRFPGFS